jgi:hypothetical protein
MFKSLARSSLVAGILLSLNGCVALDWVLGPEREAFDLTDAQLAALLEDWGGTEIREGEYEIGDYLITRTGIARDPGTIRIAAPPEAMCRKHGWTQVIRESIDGEIVHDPTDLPDPPGHPGVRAWSKPRITPDGWVVDGDPGSTDIDYGENFDREFADRPAFSNDGLEDNGLKDDARVYRLEAETCRRCLDPPPPGKFGPCFLWYFIREFKERGRSFLVTRDTPEPGPSPDFNAAVAEWQKP